MQFYAVRDIKAGDQLFFSYCLSHDNVAERQATLAPYGFVCKCTACTNATPETDKLRKTFEAKILDFKRKVATSQVNETLLKDALRLEKQMVKEGLDAHYAFESLVAVISLVCLNLGKLNKGKSMFSLWRIFDCVRMMKNSLSFQFLVISDFYCEDDNCLCSIWTV